MVRDISKATKTIVWVVQVQTYPKEFEMLSEKQLMSSPDSSHSWSSKKKLACVGYLSLLWKVSLFINNGIMCITGHLQTAPIGFDVKHPMIPPGKSFTDLIIKQYHKAEGHVGASQVLTSIRRKFWILQEHAAVRCVVGKCFKCRRWNANPCQQLMAPLPSSTITSIFFCGSGVLRPNIPQDETKSVKRCGCLFTCLAIWAVHIEIVHDLSGDSFIQAFTRFVSRHGSPVEGNQL